MAAAAATLSGGAIASAASSARQHRDVRPGQAPAIKIVNLHPAYLRALPQAQHGPVAGMLPPRGHRVTARAPHGPAGCTEPNCNLAYGNGSVQHHPHVFLLLWGPSWSSSNPSTQYLSRFYQGLGAGPDNWSTITSQYGDGSGNPTFGTSVLQGVYQDTTAPPADVTENDLTAEADAFVSNQNVSDRGDAQVVIASQPGTCFADGFAGNAGTCGTPAGGYCAWHTNSGAGETFTNLPYQLDAGAGCGENFINPGSAGTYDGFSIVGGHEYAETITDPAPYGGWYDAADTISGGEIGDKCAWAGELWGTPDPDGDVTLSTGSFAMQSLWSNAAGGCVMTGPPITGVPTVTGVSPQQGPAAGGTVVTVTGTNLSGGTVAFGAKAATGVSCTATSCTATSPAGTGKVDVRVTTAGGTSATSPADRFSYVVPPSGPITGVRGWCVADAGLANHNGNRADLWACAHTAEQVWTVEPDGTLRVVGRCLTATGTASGAKIDVTSCGGGWNQVWAHHTNGELTNPHTGKCLAVPGAPANGEQLVLQSCTDSAGQRWQIP